MWRAFDAYDVVLAGDRGQVATRPATQFADSQSPVGSSFDKSLHERPHNVPPRPEPPVGLLDSVQFVVK